jgi:hypothetical protein
MFERHCADARFVWNLAVEQFNWGHAGRPAPGPAARHKQLAQARQAFEWLAAGSSPAPQSAVSAKPGREGRMVGIDRDVATTVALSDGTMLRAPILARATAPAPTSGPEATPAPGVLAQARRPDAA